MSGKYLIDTNIVIALFAKDASVQRHIAAAEEIFIPVTVIGELFFGAFNSAHQEANLSRIEEFALFNVVLPCGVGTGSGMVIGDGGWMNGWDEGQESEIGGWGSVGGELGDE